MYYGVMPRTEKRMPFKLFRSRDSARSWLSKVNLDGWVIREFAHKVPDYWTSKSKKRIDKLF